MSDKPTVNDQTRENSPKDSAEQPLASNEDREGFVAGLIRKAKDVASGKVRSGVSDTFGKLEFNFSPEAALSKAGLPTDGSQNSKDQAQETKVPLEGLVELDAKDRPIKIVYSDGTYTTPTYDKNGALIEIKDSDNSSWKKDGDGWNRYDAAGQKIEHLDGEMFVTADGDVVARQNDGYTEILSPDQSLTKINTDNSQVVFDAEGRVVKTVDAQGHVVSRKADLYEGEIIRREVEPGIAEGTKGEQLEQIARDHLGAGATEQDVQRHVKEIAHLNEIKDPSKPLEQERLVLPGHTKDGAIITQDKDHNRKTVWSDGTVVTKNADGTGYDLHAKGDGAFQEHHWGSKPEQNYDLQRTADGRYEITQKHDAASYEKVVGEERARLEKVAEKIEDPNHREQFKKDMETLAKRSDEMQKSYKAQYEKQGLTPEEASRKAQKQAAEEIIGTYREVERMMESPAKEPLPPELRQVVALQVMHHAADPTTIDQGFHPTCNVSTVESRLYTRSPSSVARLVADTAITGECKTRGTPPMTIKLDEHSLMPDQEAMYHPPSAAARSYASQLFQIAGVNMAWEKANQRNGTNFRYEQHESTNPNDGGGRLIDYSKKPPQVQKNKDGTPDESPNINNQEITDIYNEVAGTKEKDFVVQQPFWIPDKVSNVKSPEQLGKRLEEMKKNGELPAIITLHTGKEPFYTDSGAGTAGGSGGWHVVTVTDYDPATGKVSIDNQWGEQVDRTGNNQIDVKTLYDTMSSRWQDLDAEIATERKAGKIPTAQELERLELDKGEMSDKEFEEKAIKLLVEQERAWRDEIKKGPPTTARAAEHDKAVAKATELMDRLPLAQRIRIVRGFTKELA